ncbi:hypothetical protein MY10362_008654 [Beauveria mimosiformis]
MLFLKLFSSLKNRHSTDTRVAATLRNPVKSPGSATTVAQNPADEHVVQSSSPKLECAEQVSGPLGLTVLHEPHEKHCADIIFIHGLSGSSYKTWCKDRAPGSFWPQEWLPHDEDLHSARIFTYGYNSKLKSPKKSPNFGISTFASDLLYDLVFGKGTDGHGFRLGEVPIIFVAHSMGGLVAYFEAGLNARYHHIAISTKAVVFLSTPHRGSHLATPLRLLLSILSPSNAKQYVAELDEKGPFLRELNDQFRHVAANLQIFSFFEALKTSLAGRISAMIVDGDSAKLGYPGEVCHSLETDHQGMSKFRSPHDPNYLAVREFFNTPDNIEHDIDHFESR